MTAQCRRVVAAQPDDGAEGEDLADAGGDHRGRVAHAHDGVGARFLGRRDHVGRGLIPGLGDELRVLGHGTAEDVADARRDVIADAAGAGGVAAHEADGLGDLATLDGEGGGQDHVVAPCVSMSLSPWRLWSTVSG